MPRLPASRLLVLGLVALAASALTLPFAGIEPSFAARITAYVIALVPVALFIHGFSILASEYPTPQLLTFGAIGAALGFLAALASSPEVFDDGSWILPSSILYLANVLRLCAAASLGLALARSVTSSGVALLIAAVAAASDLFSVLAGPTRALLREDSPALDLLVLIFPSFDTPLGFGLGLSDFVFLALFAYMSLLLGLRYRLTLVCCCAATLLATATALALERPLPTLPFISLCFVLVNAQDIYTAMRK